MIQVEPHVRDCWPMGRRDLPYLSQHAVRFLVVHGHGFEIPGWIRPIVNIVDLARVHERHDEIRHITGRLPYHFMALPDGTVQQGIALGYRGCHARNYNGLSIGIAVLGRFDATEQTPTEDQLSSLPRLCALLQGYFSLDIEGIVGHHWPADEPSKAKLYLPDSSSDPRKRCPGPGLDIAALRRSITELQARSLDPREYGVVL